MSYKRSLLYIKRVIKLLINNNNDNNNENTENKLMTSQNACLMFRESYVIQNM